jgi:Ricin-type beta-trefoil lectin domain
MKISPTSRPRARLTGILLAGTMMLVAILASSTAAQAATTGAATRTAATPAANAFAEIKNADTGLCIQAQTNSESDLVQTFCNGSQAQHWIFVPNGNGNHIVNQVAGLCVYMNGPVSSGSPVIQTGCTTVTNEDWKATPPPAVTTIMSRASHRDTNLCLAPESTGPGALLRIFTCNGSNAQLWVIGV